MVPSSSGRVPEGCLKGSCSCKWCGFREMGFLKIGVENVI